MSNSKVKLFVIFSLLLLSYSITSVVAQPPYHTVTTDFTISSDGTVAFIDALGVVFNIEGTPGSTGTVTTDLRDANPQPTADIPANISLTHFLYVTFDVTAANFTQAKITIPYTDSDVAGVEPPYSIFNYNPATGSYFELAAVHDTNAKTFAITVTSVDDPLLAIGGVKIVPIVPVPEGPGFIAWAALAVSIVVIVLLVVIGVWLFRKKSSSF